MTMTQSANADSLAQNLKPRHVRMLSIAGVIGAGLFVGLHSHSESSSCKRLLSTSGLDGRTNGDELALTRQRNQAGTTGCPAGATQ